MKNVKNAVAKIRTNPFKHQAWVTSGKYKKVAVAGGLIFMVAISGLAGYKIIDISKRASVPADCDQLNKEAAQLFNTNKPKEVYDKLKPHEAECGKSLTEAEIRNFSDTPQTLQTLVYKSNMAKSLYTRGDKSQAKVYAKSALDIDKYFNALQRDQIPDKMGFYFEMGDIVSGDYYYYPPRQGKPS